MGTLKTTLKVESTDLFPTPVNFTQVNNNTIGGSFSGFNSAQVATAPSSTQLNLDTVNNTAYIYLRAASTNTASIQVTVSGGSTFLSLAAGDVAFFPYGDGSGGIANITANSASASQVLEFFVGEKA